MNVNEFVLWLALSRLSGLQDVIASLTDIVASDQILIVGGRALEELINPLTPLQEYPSHFVDGSIYLFQKEMNEVNKIVKLEIRKSIPRIPGVILCRAKKKSELKVI